MNNILKLIKEEKVKWMKLGDIGQIYGGLTGKTKNDFGSGNSKFVSYKNVFSNLATNLNIFEQVNINEGEKQRKLILGDIIFTGSSENLSECGLSSVITENPKEDIYLNSFCFFLRLNDEKLLLPDFSKFLFRSEKLRKEIIKTASGVTRYNVSKEAMKKIQIPIPSLETQRKIVDILDKFTEYKDTLNEELKLRKKQYEYYRDKLLSEEYLIKKTKELCGEDAKVEVKTFEEIGKFTRGNGLQKKDFSDQGYPVIHYGQIYTKYGFSTSETISYTNELIFSKLRKANKGDILIATTSENLKDVGKSVVWLGEKEIGYSGDMYMYRTSENPKFIAYYFQTVNYQKQKERKVSGTKLIRIHGDDMGKFTIPIPPLKVQEHIVEILDKFDKLTNDIKEGLPKEIELRTKQYEYYREKLLDFNNSN